MNGAELSARLSTRWLGRALEVLAETGSTNDDVLARARAGAPHGLVVFAERQTRGRGRLGRIWHSPSGENLAFSTLLRPPAAGPPPPVTLAAGLAVHEAVNALGCAASIKWPNDVMIEGKKVAGILTETSTRGQRMEALVLGIGVNVNAAELPPEVAATATSLRVALGAPVDRPAFAAALLEALERWLDVALADGAVAVARAFRARSGMLGRRVQVTIDGALRGGTVRDLGDDGALEILDDAGELRRIVSGVVEVAS